MRAAVMTAKDTIELREVAVPTVDRGTALLRPVRVGLCGSDLHALAGAHPFVDFPIRPGHEVLAEVVETSDGSRAPGERVVVQPNIVCGACHYCRQGRPNLCAHLAVIGFQTEGALAERMLAPLDRLHVVPDAMSDAAAGLVEPLTTAVHAVRVAGDLTGAMVAVLGAGSIGLLTMLAARHAGARAVAVTDLRAPKLERATALGADLAVDARDDDLVERVRSALSPRPDIVFDCVADQASMDQAVALTLKGGTTVIVGVPHGPVRVPIELVQDRELRIQGTAMYDRHDMARAIELIGEGLPVGDLVTAEFPMDRLEDAFAAAAAGEQVKVHVLL